MQSTSRFAPRLIPALLLIAAAMVLKPASFLVRGTLGVLTMLAVCAVGLVNAASGNVSTSVRTGTRGARATRG